MAPQVKANALIHGALPCTDGPALTHSPTVWKKNGYQHFSDYIDDDVFPSSTTADSSADYDHYSPLNGTARAERARFAQTGKQGHHYRS